MLVYEYRYGDDIRMIWKHGLYTKKSLFQVINFYNTFIKHSKHMKHSYQQLVNIFWRSRNDDNWRQIQKENMSKILENLSNQLKNNT